MTTKEYLSQAFTLNRLIKAKQRNIQNWRDTHEWTERNLIDQQDELPKKLLRLINECQKDISRLAGLQREIEAVVELTVPEDCRVILYERYVNLEPWYTIAKYNNYSEKHVYKLHKKGLSHLDSLLESQDGKDAFWNADMSMIGCRPVMA